jgi:HEAT repeat protein
LVRETALNTIGVIGMPEAMEAINEIIICLEDKDSNVKSMAAWCIGKLGPQASKIAA